MAKSDSEVLIEEPDQRIAACGFSLAYAANRKIAARASRPRISSVRASGPRVSLAVIGGLIRLLAQERVEKGGIHFRKLSDHRGSIGPTARLARIIVHLQREIVMHQIDFSARDVVV